MLRRTITLVVFSAAVSTSANAQDTLTPDQLRALVDERVAAQNPFEELLNDSDPARSLAAMEIMLEQGDSTLRRMALEFGLLSTNPTVRRTAVEAFLRSKPVLSLRFDGTAANEQMFQRRMTGENATLTPEKIGYWRQPVGDYDEAQKCYKHAAKEACFITVNSDGVIFQNEGYMTARATIGEAGELVGSATLYQVQEPVPMSVKLLD